MFYRVHAWLHFNIPDEGRDFYHDCEKALPKGITINPGQDTEEKGVIELEQCFHDEDPTKPCVLLASDHTP